MPPTWSLARQSMAPTPTPPGGVSGASEVVERDALAPHLAQQAMEPPAAVALFEDGRWEIWAPTQGPELTQHYVGLAMLEPDPVKWLLWQVTELTEILKEYEREEQPDFNEYLAKMIPFAHPPFPNPPTTPHH